VDVLLVELAPAPLGCLFVAGQSFF